MTFPDEPIMDENDFSDEQIEQMWDEGEPVEIMVAWNLPWVLIPQTVSPLGSEERGWVARTFDWHSRMADPKQNSSRSEELASA